MELKTIKVSESRTVLVEISGIEELKERYGTQVFRPSELRIELHRIVPGTWRFKNAVVSGLVPGMKQRRIFNIYSQRDELPDWVQKFVDNVLSEPV